MGDEYTISPSEEIAHTAPGLAGGTGTFTIDIGDYNDIGSGFSYNTTYSVEPEVGGEMRKRLEAIEARLNILVPDPAKLEKYEALQKAYEHYKTMERLCVEEEEDDN
jgi:hypothetical protein